MNIILVKIICSWLLLVLFGLLLLFYWPYRFLWVALLPAAVVLIELIGPRRPAVPPGMQAGIKTRVNASLWALAIVWVLTVVFHGFLYPHSADLYLFCKVACAAAAAPLLYLKVLMDYHWLRTVEHASVEPGVPLRRTSAETPEGIRTGVTDDC